MFVCADEHFHGLVTTVAMSSDFVLNSYRDRAFRESERCKFPHVT